MSARSAEPSDGPGASHLTGRTVAARGEVSARAAGAYDGPVHPPIAARRRGALTAALLVLGLSAGCAGSGEEAAPKTSATRTQSPASTSQQNAAEPTITREQSLQELLEGRAAAVRTRNRQAFAASLDNPRSAFGLRQLALFDNLVRLPLGTFDYGTPEPAPALGQDRIKQLGPEAWVSRIRCRYTLKGFDRSPRSYETHLTVVRRGDVWKLADDSDGGTQTQLWDLPGMRVLQSPTTLVVGSAKSAHLEGFLRMGDRAVARVSKVWKRPWGARLVLVVPADTDQMAAQLGQQSAEVDQVAAVTDGPLEADGRAGADRIVVNPQAFARLQNSGQQVVITHETTHVAIRATTNRPVPLWLSEGMADYVGYSGLDIGRAQIAAPLMGLVRAGKGPKALPAEVDFDPSRSTIAPSYNAAWLAVSLIAETYGQSRLVSFYEHAATQADPSAGPGDPDRVTGEAFAQVLGVSAPEFTRSWLAYLDRLAGV